MPLRSENSDYVGDGVTVGTQPWGGHGVRVGVMVGVRVGGGVTVLVGVGVGV